MNVSQRIIKNSIILNTSHVISKLINLALILVFTRMLGTEGFGIYNFSYAYVIIFMVLANLGINTLLTREIARNKSQINLFLGKSIPLLIILSVIVLFVINISISFIRWDTTTKLAIRIFSLFLVFDNFSRHFIAVFRAFEKMEYEAFTNLIEKSLMLLVSLILWQLGHGLTTLLWSFVIIEFLKTFSAYLFMKRFFEKISWHWFNIESFKILKEAYPFALIVIFLTVSGRIDTIMLKIFHGDQMVGLYNAAHKLIESLFFIPENICLALFPALSVLSLSKEKNFQKVMHHASTVLTLTAIPIGFGIFILAPQIIELLFEPEFSLASIPLRWLAIALSLIFIKYLYATTLNAIGKQHIFAIIAAISMIINCLLNYILIPPYDLLGASIATIISEILSVVWVIYYVTYYTQHKIPLAVFLKSLIASITMGLFLIQFHHWHIIILIAIAIILYLSILLILRTHTNIEFQYLINIIRRKKEQA